MQRMVQACAYPVALIVAPAGYGKTVGLRQYLESLDSPHVRFDVRPEHETLHGFVRGFAESMVSVAPEMRAALGDALRGPSTAPQLAEWAATHLREFHGLVAIDDLHLASDHGITVFLRSLIERLKGQVCWVVASRSTPALPIATWMTYGDMDIVVDERDLAFTVDEAKQAGDETGACEEELRRFIEMTGGWATALSFAMRSRVRTSELEAIGHATREMVYRYLAEQVYEQLSDVERQLLHLAAYMPVIDVELLVAAGFPDAYALLEQLRKRTAFLSIEGERTYRCHDLFREFLQYQVERMGGAICSAVQYKVAQVLRDYGCIAAALRIYARLRAIDEVRDILAGMGFELLDTGLSDAASAAIEVLPQAIANGDPAILLIRASIEKNRGHFDRAEKLLTAATDVAQDPLTTAHIKLRQANLWFEQVRDVSSVLNTLSLADLPVDMQATAIGYLLASHALNGRETEAMALFPVACRLAVEVESDLERARLYHRCGIAAYALLKPLEEVEAFFHQAIAVADRGGYFVTSTAAIGALAEIRVVYHDDYEGRAVIGEKALAAAEKAGDAFSMESALVRVINAYCDLGEFDRAARFFEQLGQWKIHGLGRSGWTAACRAMFAAVDGRFEDAYDFIGSSKNSCSFDKVLNTSMRALYALSAGRTQLAVPLCDDVSLQLRSGGFATLHAKACAEVARLIAVIVYAYGKQPHRARELLLQPSIVVTAYTKPLQSLAQSVVQSSGRLNKSDVRAAAEGMREAGRGGIAAVLDAALPKFVTCEQNVPLSPAEAAILRALDLGCSPKQIAFSTGRSVHTVRTLIQRAVERLGCSGRQEALAMARRMGMLDSRPEQDAPLPARKASEL